MKLHVNRPGKLVRNFMKLDLKTNEMKGRAK